MRRKKAASQKLTQQYSIFRIEECSEHPPKKVVLEEFDAENDEEAYAHLKAFKKTADKAYVYYYGRVDTYVSIDENGGKKEYKSSREMHDDWLKDRSVWEKIETELRFRWSKVVDCWQWLKQLWYYIRTGHDYKASWSLDVHLLKEIAWNLKILKDDEHGCSFLFLDRARAALHKDEEGFSMEEYAAKMNYCYTDEEWRLAKTLRAQEYSTMLLNIALYSYYSSFGVADKEYVEDVEEFEKTWSKTLPYKPGTYRELDYKKLDALAAKHWAKIWAWMKTYGQALWS